MKIRWRLVDWLIKISPQTYRDKVVIEKGVKVLYVEIVRAIYGMLEAALMWYRRFRTDLEKEGFKFHDYDPCIAFKDVEGSQHLVQFHVDDILSSHMKAKVNDEFALWAQQKYGEIKDDKVKRGKIFKFLGMVLDFSHAGECHVLQEDHVDDIVRSWSEEIKKTAKELTPCTSNHFDRGEGRLLCNERRGIFHTIAAKCLFVGNRSRPDTLPTVSLLTSRVREPNEDDWKKARRLIQYLCNTKKLHLVLRWDGTRIARWHVDAAFAVHKDFKSHSGGLVLLHEDGGSIAAGSTRQKINTRSSTVAELVAVDDFLSKIIWLKKFLQGLGYGLRQNILFQDNTSTIIMQKNGRNCLGKRNRAIDIRYFAIKDSVDSGDIEIKHCGTNDMVADYMSKGLRGKKFLEFRKLILGM